MGSTSEPQTGASGPGGHRVDHPASVVLKCFT